MAETQWWGYYGRHKGIRRSPLSIEVDCTKTINYSPEQRLCLAVVEQALDEATLRGPQTTRKPRYQLEAYEWVMSRSCEVQSFEWMCAGLSLNPGVLRDSLHRYLEEAELTPPEPRGKGRLHVISGRSEWRQWGNHAE